MLDLEILQYWNSDLWKAWVCVCCWAELKVTEYSYSQFDAFLDQWISFSTSRGSLVKTQNCQSCFDWLVLKSKQKIFDDYWEQLTLRSFQIFFVFWRVWKFWTLEQGISHSTQAWYWFHSSLRGYKRSKRLLAQRFHQHSKGYYCLQLKLGNKVRDLFSISQKAFNILQIHHFIHRFMLDTIVILFYIRHFCFKYYD